MPDQQIDVDLPEEVANVLDERAALYGMQPSDLLRLLMLNDLAGAGIPLSREEEKWRKKWNKHRDRVDRDRSASGPS